LTIISERNLRREESTRKESSMNARLCRGGLVALVAIACLLSLRPGNVQAHPRLTGHWEAVPHTGLTLVYEFGPGQYGTGGVWFGSFTYFVNGCPVSTGLYELRVCSGTQATLGLKDGPLIGTDVANIDLGERVMTLKNVTFTFHP
jgi:hypothetical protein